ncbi:MAG: methyltransferase [Candidatus Nanopelagicaceae bacterium]|jgi:predicted TPR repeat methyltransferase
MADEETSAPLGLTEAYSVKTPEDNRRLYAKWASTYESEFVEKKQYRYPKAIAEVFNEKVPRNALHVVDVGTGTGLTGTYLVAHRSEITVDGIDISSEMLEQAKGKTRLNGDPVYRELFERDLTQEVLLTRDPYDALICSGTFTHGHLGPEAIENLIELVRPGGWLVIGVNNEHFIARGFDGYLARLTAEAVIAEPIILRVDVYEAGSAHRGDQARILIFSRR